MAEPTEEDGIMAQWFAAHREWNRRCESVASIYEERYYSDAPYTEAADFIAWEQEMKRG